MLPLIGQYLIDFPVPVQNVTKIVHLKALTDLESTLLTRWVIQAHLASCDIIIFYVKFHVKVPDSGQSRKVEHRLSPEISVFCAWRYWLHCGTNLTVIINDFNEVIYHWFHNAWVMVVPDIYLIRLQDFQILVRHELYSKKWHAYKALCPQWEMVRRKWSLGILTEWSDASGGQSLRTLRPRHVPENSCSLENGS